MAQVHQPEVLSFANNFWGDGESGVPVLLTRVNDVKHTFEELQNFYRERAIIEEEYSRKLIALSRKTLGSFEIGTLREALDNVRQTTEITGKSHATAASQIRSELSEPLTTFSNNSRNHKKNIQALVDKLTKTKQSYSVTTERNREKFELECNKINSYYAQQNLLMGRELERNNAKLDKAHLGVESSKREYQNSLRLLAEASDMWAKEWKLACDKFQDLEEERVNFLKSNLWNFTNVISTVCVNDDEGCENIRVSLEKTDAYSDNDLFVRTNATGSEIMDPPAFINYLGGKSNDSTARTFETAHFPRVSQAGLEHQVNYNPAASVRGAQRDRMSARHSLAQSQGQNQNQNQNQQSHYQRQPYISDTQGIQEVPTLNPPNDDYESQRGSPIQRLMSPQGSMSSNPTSISDVEQEHDLAPPMKGPYGYNSNNSNSDLANSQSARLVLPSDNSPRFQRGEMSPGSPYSTKSASNSNPNLGAATVAMHTPSASPTRKPVQSQHAQQKSPSYNDSQDDTPKKRTWASPFRRRSKKDLNKGYNAGSTSTSPTKPHPSDSSFNASPKPQSSTSSFNPPRAPFSSGPVSRPGSAAGGSTTPTRQQQDPRQDLTPTKPSTVLSMGDNLFDLGVNSRSSPYDSQRSKSVSPAKSFSRDDPLVMALEKLKVTGGSNTPADDMPGNPIRRPTSGTPIQGKPGYGQPQQQFNGLPQGNRSSPALRHQNSGSALIPPGPAFTSGEMKAASGRYSNQTREMFDQQQRGGPGSDGYYNSNDRSMRSSMDRRAASPGPQGHQMQRPRTMYDGDFQNMGQYGVDGMNRGHQQQHNTSMIQHQRSQSASPMKVRQGNVDDRYGPSSGFGGGRSASPNPMMMNNGRSPSPNPMTMSRGRSPSPNPMMMNRGISRSPSPNPMMMRGRSNSPNPQGYGSIPAAEFERYPRSGSGMGGPGNRAVSPGPGMMGRSSGPIHGVNSPANRNSYYGHDQNSNGGYDQQQQPQPQQQPRGRPAINARSSQGSFVSNASGSAMFNGNTNNNSRRNTGNGPLGDLPTVSQDGRPVLHYSQANFDYRAAIPEEVSFRQGDIMLVIKMLEDGWWETEVLGEGRVGLAPSNFLSDL